VFRRLNGGPTTQAPPAERHAGPRHPAVAVSGQPGPASGRGHDRSRRPAPIDGSRCDPPFCKTGPFSRIRWARLA
jgi:hypothetical protein